MCHTAPASTEPRAEIIGALDKNTMMEGAPVLDDSGLQRFWMGGPAPVVDVGAVGFVADGHDLGAELPEAEQPPSSPEMTLEERTLEQISNRPNLLAQPAKPTDTPSFEKERGDREVPRSASFTRADMSQIGRFPNERALVPRRFLSASALPSIASKSS